MHIEESALLRGFVRLCEDGWLQGWHERNGGNLTYRLSAEEAEACRPDFSRDRPWNPIGAALPGLAGETFLAPRATPGAWCGAWRPADARRASCRRTL